MTEPEPEQLADSLHSGYAAGDTAASDVYLVHGRYEQVQDLDPETGQLSETRTVEVERVYPTPRVAFELGDGERGNVLVAAGTVISDEVATQIAAGVPQ